MIFNVLGLDPGSKRTAYWLYNAHRGPSAFFGFIPSTPEAAKQLVSTASTLTKGNVTVACEWIKGGGFAPYRVPHLITTARAEGYIASACMETEVSITCVAAGDWRKAVVGKAKASDKYIKAWVYEMYPRLGQTNCHVRDALCLAHYVAHAERYMECLPSNDNKTSPSSDGSRRKSKRR